ncbi:MAG: hypothetical protein ACI9BW_001530 [Gammaproteobacteria bacterium]|jgi:hypothetical protein
MNWKDVFLQRLGCVPRQRERTLCIHGDSCAAFESIWSVVLEISKTQSRLRIILCSHDPGVRTALTQKYPEFLVWASPFGNALSCGMFLARANVRTVVALEGTRTISIPLVRELKRRAISLVGLFAREAATRPRTELAQAFEVAIRVADSSGGINRQLDRKSEHQVQSIAAVTNILSEMLGRDMKALRDEKDPANKLAEFILKHGECLSIRWRLRRIQDLDELSTTLGDPESILCLGNGPSSEDPKVQKQAHDVLFRVNHSWLKRGYLCDPDIVFTGGKPTMRTVSGAIFGLHNPACAPRLVMSRFFKPWLQSTRFFDVADLSPALQDFAWGANRPTNGASMLAAAVALKPKRLIVGGIDLFQHPSGTYPGDTTTPNAFSPAHAREPELAFLLELFDSYRGDLVIIGDVLRAHWERHRESRGLTLGNENFIE